MAALIDTLIDKNDVFELVGLKIAGILAEESEEQVTLATNAAKPDPDLWKLRVFSERANPWEAFRDLDANATTEQKAPIVNVWFNDSTFDKSASDTFARQLSRSNFNIDVYGFGVSTDNPAGGHNAGDEDAALTVHRAVRLCRNILMSAQYDQLDLNGIVWDRWPDSITVFQPTQGDAVVENIVAARLQLNVAFNEFSPQWPWDTLERVTVDYHRGSDGLLTFTAAYEYPL